MENKSGNAESITRDDVMGDADQADSDVTDV